MSGVFGDLRTAPHWQWAQTERFELICLCVCAPCAIVRFAQGWSAGAWGVVLHPEILELKVLASPFRDGHQNCSLTCASST